jgi:hypothetical protein
MPNRSTRPASRTVAARRRSRSAGVVQPVTGLSQSFRRHGARLMNQQCWCWGQDVRREEGNLLIAYGCSRERPPAGIAGATMYTIRPESRSTIVLWAFGLFYGQQGVGGLFVPRFGFTPSLVSSEQPPAGVWSPNHLPPMAIPTSATDWHRAGRLLAAAVRWIAGYEEWVLAHYGAAYRDGIVAKLPYATIPVENMPAEWLALMPRCEALGGETASA